VDFFSIILFLALYYIRPHEWMPIVGALRPMILTVILALVSLFREHSGIGLRELFKTPHDWVMAAFLAWIVGASPTHWDTFLAVYNGFVFYWITVLTLTNVQRMTSFLNWWTVLVLLLAAFALASEYGFDPTNAYEITHGRMKDRLILNTSIFNNPNALGHGVVPAVVMIYFISFWKRPVFSKIFTPFLMFIPLACLYLTLSKGAFLSCFATIINALTFKRPKTVQILIVFIALTSGWAAVRLMPRMSELETTKHDQAIQGRVHAFQFGYRIMTTTTTGLGYGHFIPEFFKEHHYAKASHSSFVNIGCELGWPGLTVFLAVFYCCLRTLIFAKTTTDDEERVRRILFVLIISYLVSSWMVNFEYRATFYLMVGATAAFHRYLLLQQQPQTETSPAETEADSAPLVTYARLQPVSPTTREISTANTTIHLPPPDQATTPATNSSINWNRISLLDVVLIGALYWATRIFWKTMMGRM
jgi:hypothetical protein